MLQLHLQFHVARVRSVLRAQAFTPAGFRWCHFPSSGPFYDSAFHTYPPSLPLQTWSRSKAEEIQEYTAGSRRFSAENSEGCTRASSAVICWRPPTLNSLCPKNVGGTTQTFSRIRAILPFPISLSPSHTFLRSASSKLQKRGRGSLSQPACEPDLLLLLYCHSSPHHHAIAGDSLTSHTPHTHLGHYRIEGTLDIACLSDLLVKKDPLSSVLVRQIRSAATTKSSHFLP